MLHSHVVDKFFKATFLLKRFPLGMNQPRVFKNKIADLVFQLTAFDTLF